MFHNSPPPPPTFEYPLPTHNDIIQGLLIADRILLRKMFEKLKSRKGAKYFKNIIIRNIPWGDVTPIPLNFPDEFRKKYPFDFVAEFTTLGCNMLKCYKHDYKKPCLESYIINDNIPTCSEACYKIYEEFNDFLAENFKLTTKTIKNSLDAVSKRPEIFFETFSIEKHYPDGSGIEKCYCGMQLTNLKRFAILPSSRWIINDNSSDKKEKDLLSFNSSSPSSTFLTKERYLELRVNDPAKVCDMSGLVDAPPLSWDVQNQNIKYNQEYCQRFRKEYNAKTDACEKSTHRKVLGYVFGDAVMNQLSDSDIVQLSTIPITYIIKSATTDDNDNKFFLNPGYTEKKIKQKKIELGFFTNEADKIIKRLENVTIIKPQNERDVVGSLMVGHYKGIISSKVGEDVGNAALEIIRSMGETILIEESILASPVILAFLLKYYTKNYVMITTKNINTIGVGMKGLIECGMRLTAVILRTIISEVWIQLAIKSLTMLSSAANTFLSLGLLTIIPEILLVQYNVGGYNRELSRKHLELYRQENVDSILKQLASNNEKKKGSFLSPLSYISITNQQPQQDEEKYSRNIISPFITPEFIYNICIINFHTTFPENINDIGRTGIDPNEEMTLLFEYISLLKVNSLGQYINIQDYNDLSITDTMLTIFQNDNNKNKINTISPESILENSTNKIKEEIEKLTYDITSLDLGQKIIGKNYDLYILKLTALFAIIVCFFMYGLMCNYCHQNKFKVLSGVIITFSFIGCCGAWFYIFKPLINKQK